MNWYKLAKQKKPNIEKEVINFFLQNPNPSDKALHKWAEQNGLDEHQVEEIIYALLSSVLNAGQAKKKAISPDDVDPKELAKGIKVEQEHTTNEFLAERIALDHLAEMPDYYTKLNEMEGEGMHD